MNAYVLQGRKSGVGPTYIFPQNPEIFRFGIVGPEFIRDAIFPGPVSIARVI